MLSLILANQDSRGEVIAQGHRVLPSLATHTFPSSMSYFLGPHTLPPHLREQIPLPSSLVPCSRAPPLSHPSLYPNGD